jgi:hypothetical protein
LSLQVVLVVVLVGEEGAVLEVIGHLFQENLLAVGQVLNLH